MSDDAGSLDVAVAGKHWYVEGGGGRRFATKGEAIAYAWTLTIPGGVRPSVKTRGDVVRAPEPRQPKPGHEVKITVDENEDEVAWTAVGDILSASWRSAPTVTIEITMPVPLGAGLGSPSFREQVQAELEAEAHSRGLQLVGGVTHSDVLSNGRREIMMRASAQARARE